MATPAGGHFFCFGRRKWDSRTLTCRGAALRIAHLPPLRGGAPEAPLSASTTLAALAATDLTEEGDSKAVALQGAAGPRNVAESHFAIACDGRAPRAHVPHHSAAACGDAPEAQVRSASSDPAELVSVFRT